MGKIISLVNQKGGVGKTTTSINLSASLARLGKKILLIDLDPQGNATTGVGINKGDISKSVYDLLRGVCEPEETIIKTEFGNLDILPSTIQLAGIDIEFMDRSRQDTSFRKAFQLKEKLEKIKNNYDYIIIDCPPSLGMITTNALTASNSCLIPVQCEYYALEGLSQLIHTINLVKQRLNPELEMEGVVFTMYDARTNLSLEVVENVKKIQLDVHQPVMAEGIPVSLDRVVLMPPSHQWFYREVQVLDEVCPRF